MSSKDVKVRLLLEDKVSPELKKINKEVNNINSSFKKVGENGRALSKAIQQATQSAKALNSALKQTNALKNQVNQMKQYNTQIQKAVQNANKLNTTLKGINSNKNINVNSMFDAKQFYNQLKGAVNAGKSGNGFGMMDFMMGQLLSAGAKSSLKKLTPIKTFKEAYGKAFDHYEKQLYTSFVRGRVRHYNKLSPQEQEKMVSKLCAYNGIKGRNNRFKSKLSTAKFFNGNPFKNAIEGYRGFREDGLGRKDALGAALWGFKTSFNPNKFAAVGAGLKATAVASSGTIATAGLTVAITAITTAVLASVAGFKLLTTVVQNVTQGFAKFVSVMSSKADEVINSKNRIALGVGADKAGEYYYKYLDRATALRADSGAYSDVVAGLITRVSAKFSGEEGANRAADIADVMFASGVISGSSQTEISASNLQLLQALGSGVLQGEELRSVMENNPVLAQVISHGTGIAYGDLKTAAANGELDTDRVLNALEQAVSDNGNVLDLVKGMSWTSEQLLTVAKNTGEKYIKPIIDDFETSFGWLADNFVLPEMNNENSGLKSSVSNAWNNFKSGLLGSFGYSEESGGSGAYGAFNQLLDNIESIGNSGAFKGLGEIVGSIGNAIVHISTSVADAFKNDIDWDKHSKAFTDAIKSIADNISTAIDNGLIGQLLTLGDTLLWFAEQASKALNLVSGNGFGNVSDYGSVAWAQLQANAGNYSNLDKVYGEGNWSISSNGAINLADAIIEAMQQGTFTAGSATSSSTTTGSATNSATTPQYTVAEAETVKEVYDNSEEIQAELTAIAAVSGETLTTVDGMCSEISTMIGELVISASTWGYDFVNNLSAGIMSGYSTLIAAMDSIVAQLSRPEFSINHNDEKLRGQEKWGTHYVENLSNAIHNAIPVLSSAVGEVANTLAFDSDGKLDDNMVSTLRDFRSSDNNRSINNNMPVNITFGDVHQNADMNYISKQLELSLRNALASSL